MVTNNLPCPGLPGITSSVNGINFSNSCNENEGIATNSRGLMVPVGMPFLSGLTPEQPYYPGHPYANSMYGNYDFSGYPMLRNGYGMDLNGSRRKNATRETTSTLKAWLNDHRKNPYPTKAEKIMLAIITQMNLTQVSTWFANARRRLKKENKMTWSPRNRCDDDDDDDDFKESGFNSLTDTRDVDGTPLGSVNHYRRRLKRENRMTYSPSPTPTLSSSSTTIPTLDQTNAPSPPTSKPRIWSIVDLATSNTSNS